MRQPIVMSIANRAVGAPLSIWNDQQDSIALRDAGWFQLYAEDAQEITDFHFLAYKVAEDNNILLPGFICFDGFILSHTYEPVDIPDQESVSTYLPPYKPVNILDADDPMSLGMYATPDYYMEFRYELDQAMKRSASALCKAGSEFEEIFGRDYSSLIEEYRMDDADFAYVAIGSVCGTVKDAIDEMRDDGKKVGLVKIRSYRPFPDVDLHRALSGIPVVAVLEKNVSIGSRMKGAVGLEVKDAIADSGVAVYSYIVGLGGRDIRKKHIRGIYEEAMKGNGDIFYGLREELL